LIEKGKLDEAESLTEMVEKRNRPQLPKPNAHIRLNAALMLRAAVAVEKGDKAHAQQLLEESLAILSETYPPDHRLVLSTARAIQNLKTKGHFREY